MDNELCGNCGRAIGKMEKPCVFDGNVVCFECDQRLRRQATVATMGNLGVAVVQAVREAVPAALAKRSGVPAIAVLVGAFIALITALVFFGNGADNRDILRRNPSEAYLYIHRGHRKKYFRQLEATDNGDGEVAIIISGLLFVGAAALYPWKEVKL